MMKHTFIEASAGTGKTYQIMELLGSWMEEYSLSEENILKKVLILTFTEKAAGELKERLRKKILDQKLNSSQPESYSRYLMELDQVTISTIHGFCNQILRTYPIETNTSTDWKLGDTQEKLEAQLSKLIHHEWETLAIPEESLITLILGTDFFNKYQSDILETASKILTGRDYLIDVPNETTFILDKNYIQMQLKALEELVFPFYEWIKDQDQQDVLVKKGKLCTEKWGKLTDFLKEKSSFPLEIFLGKLFRFFPLPFNDIEEGLNQFIFKKDSFSTDKKKLSRVEIVHNRTSSVCEQLFVPIKNILNTFDIDLFLQKTALYLVQQIKEDIKISNWQSYDQMILTVHDALENNSELLDNLREKYNVCLLDEFQDTDLSQYGIFRKIFLQATDNKHFLYLIGDPKQSIYSFRGGDLGTYLSAKEEIGDSDSSPLTTNRRSVKGLISGYNRIFGIGNPGSTFFPMKEIGIENQEIIYTEIKAPPDSEQKVKLVSPFLEGPIQIVNLNSRDVLVERIQNEKVNQSIAKDRWNLFVSYEIERLKKIGFSFEENGKEKKINFKDMAILVKRRQDGILIESELRSKNIPCMFYKQPGIYQSKECDQIKNILECLLNPNDPASYRKLLLGDLFQINPSKLRQFDEHSIDSYEKKCLDHWRKLIRSDQYAEFFRRLEEDTKIFYTLNPKDIIWERRRTNYRQIFQKLLEFQIANQADLPELLEELNRWREENKKEQELPLFDRETEEDAVQILTIHASKGLEWPIVFVQDFSGLPKNRSCYDYPVNTESGRRWGLSLWRKNFEDFEKTTLNETSRLYYVAITRAKIRLYLPFVQLPSRGKPTPYHQYLYSSLLPIVNETYAPFPNEEFSLRSFEEPTKRTTEKFNPADLKNEKNNLDSIKPILLKFENIKNPRRIYLHSYSSLKKGVIKETNKIEETLGTSDPASEFIETSELPSSANTGLFLHSLLENIPFQLFEDSIEDPFVHHLIGELVEKQMNDFGLSNDSGLVSSYRQHTFNLLKNTLRGNLPLNDLTYFQLSELKYSERSQEMDFNTLISSLFSIAPSQNFLKGSIDLVIYKNGKFFLADYKSDRLSQYDNDSLSNRISDYKYDLQRDIYAYIFFEYLKSLYNEEKALNLFGGVYYLFIRGMKENLSDGVYADLGNSGNGAWNKQRFQEIKKNIDSLIFSTIHEVVR